MSRRPRDKEQEENARRERLAYVGALAAGLVHEVRTPLHAIQLNAQMLAEDVDNLPDTVRDKFERRAKRIHTEVKALSNTLDSFLTFVRPPRPDPTPTDINRFIREVIDFVEPEMSVADVSIEVELAPDMFPVILDHNQFSHVFLNLLRNAKEAIEQRQEKEADLFDGVIRVRTDESERQIRILIEDNGIGIDPEDAERVFEVFYTTKQKGTGLGLGIVRRIVEDHRGTIDVIDGELCGACFCVTLPRGHFLEFRDDVDVKDHSSVQLMETDPDVAIEIENQYGLDE